MNYNFNEFLGQDEKKKEPDKPRTTPAERIDIIKSITTGTRDILKELGPIFGAKKASTADSTAVQRSPGMPDISEWILPASVIGLGLMIMAGRRK